MVGDADADDGPDRRSPPARPAARAERLGRALRDNLRKRKAQARERAADGAEDEPGQEEQQAGGPPAAAD